MSAVDPQSSALPEETMWQAVLDRNPEFDGQFFYAVQTTGIYCHPSCSARPPRRQNVSYYSFGADAAANGYRPCKRCRPDAGTPAQRQAAQVELLCRQIEGSSSDVPLSDLAQTIGASPSHTHKLFQRVTGITPKQYAVQCRKRRLQDELPRSPSINRALLAAGYGSPTRFYSTAPAVLGMKPASFRDGGASETIRFAVAESSLGPVLVAATERGICSIALDDDPQKLVDELSAQFPAAELVGADRDFEHMVASVVSLVEHPRREAHLPLDIQGTAFQRRVWSALSEIPPGLTTTYTELAQSIGSPRAARAVAHACASNRLAVAVPCHRVVRRDGGLAGYRWGVERKKELLEREQIQGSTQQPDEL